MSRVLVTGAGGFLGSHLCAALQAAGHTVTGVDRHPPRWAAAFPPPERYYIADLRDGHVANAYLRQTEAVYDLAANMGGVGYLAGQQHTLWRDNVRSNLAVIEAAATQGARYLCASSDGIYAPGLQSRADDPALTEGAAWPAAPENAYYLAKLVHERCAGWYAVERGLTVRVARINNTYGPYGAWRGGREKAVAALCRKVAVAKLTGADHITLWGDGGQVRTFVYVDDTIAGLMALMASDVVGPVNLSTDEVVTVDQLARLVMTAANIDLTIAHTPGPEGVRARHSSARRAREEVGWRPLVPLRDGLARTYPWIEGEVAAALARGEEVEA